MKSIFNESTIAKYPHPYIRLVVGSTTITADDIVAGSFSYKGGASSGGSLEPGGCIIGSIGFSVYNYDGKYSNIVTEGASVTAYIGYGQTMKTAAYKQIAKGTIAEWNIKRGTISVTAYDNLRKADKTYWTSWSFPMTVSEIISTAASDAGISVASLPSAGGSISVDLRTLNEDGTYSDPTISMTCRQAISEALKLSGNFGYCNENGALKCGWFNWNSPAATIEDTFSASFTGARSYTGVQVGTRETRGSADYLFALSSNNFLTDDNAEDVESRLYDALVGYSFDCGSAGIIQNPNIEPGDVITLVTPMGTKTVPVTAITLKGSMVENISCEANSYDEAEDERTDATNDALAEELAGFDPSGLETQITGLGTDVTGLTASQNALKDSLEALTKQLGGYSLVVCTDTEYGALTPDENTIYFVYEV